jgi:hypothetical protein
VKFVRYQPKKHNDDHEAIENHEIDRFDILSVMHDVPVNLMLFRRVEFFIFINFSSKLMVGHGRKYEGNYDKKRDPPRRDKFNYLVHFGFLSYGRKNYIAAVFARGSHRSPARMAAGHP